MIDLSGLSLTELQALIVQAGEVHAALQVQIAAQTATRRQRIGQSIAALDALLGSPDDPPYDPAGAAPPTIRSVGKHPEEVLAQHPGLVLKLLLQGMEQLTSTTRDLALVVAESQES